MTLRAIKSGGGEAVQSRVVGWLSGERGIGAGGGGMRLRGWEEERRSS